MLRNVRNETIGIVLVGKAWNELGRSSLCTKLVESNLNWQRGTWRPWLMVITPRHFHRQDVLVKSRPNVATAGASRTIHNTHPEMKGDTGQA